MSTEALQDVLVAEHAALFVLSAVGGQTSSASEPALYAAITAAWTAHRDRRDLLSTRIVELGDSPLPAAAAYDVPAGPAQSVALGVERTCAAHYAAAVAATTGEDRSWAITALDDAAARELALGGDPSAFPGLDELAGR